MYKFKNVQDNINNCVQFHDQMVDLPFLFWLICILGLCILGKLDKYIYFLPDNFLAYSWITEVFPPRANLNSNFVLEMKEWFVFGQFFFCILNFFWLRVWINLGNLKLLLYILTWTVYTSSLYIGYWFSYLVNGEILFFTKSVKYLICCCIDMELYVYYITFKLLVTIFLMEGNSLVAWLFTTWHWFFFFFLLLYVFDHVGLLRIYVRYASFNFWDIFLRFS